MSDNNETVTTCTHCAGTGKRSFKKTRNVDTGRFAGWHLTDCPVCHGNGVIARNATRAVTAMAELVTLVAAYTHGVDYMDDIVETALRYIATKTPTHARWFYYTTDVREAVERCYCGPDHSAAVEEIMTWVEQECNHRESMYLHALEDMTWRELQEQVRKRSKATGQKPVKRTRRSLAAFYAATFPVSQ